MSSQVMSSQVMSSQVMSCQVKSRQVKASQGKLRQVKSIYIPHTSIKVQTPKNVEFLTFSRIDRPSLGLIPGPSIAYFQGSTTSKNIDFSKIEKSDFHFLKILKIVISTIREGWISLKVGFLKNHKNP